MKVLKRLIVVLAVLLVVIVLIAASLLGTIVKTAVEQIGPKVVGVPITLDKPEISLIRGNIRLDNFIVGNPEGFKSPYAFKLGSFKIDMDMGTLASDKMVINEILIDGPEIIYEVGLGNSNIGKILENLEKEETAEKSEPEEEKEVGDEAGSAKVQISSLTIVNGKIKFSAKLAGGKAVVLPLPKINLKDIGKDSKDGASIVDVVTEVMQAIMAAIAKTIGSSAELLGQGLVSAGGMAADGVTAAGAAAADGLNAIGDTASEGVQAVGGVAAEGVKAVGEGAGKVFRSATDIFKGKKED